MADKYVDKVAMQENITKTKEYVDKKHTQVNSLPIPSIDYLHRVYQYVGTTGNGYTHNYFYECVSDGESTPTYFWQQTSVQPASSLAVEDSEGTTLASRDTMQFGTGFNATDDSENEKTVVEADVMQSGDMDDIVTPLPSIKNKLPVLFDESGAERVVGWYKYANGTKKPVYEKYFVEQLTAINQWKRVEVNEYVDTMISLVASVTNNSFIAGGDGNAVSTIAMVFNNSTNQILCYSKQDNFLNVPWRITIQYTKTTDTATT